MVAAGRSIGIEAADTAVIAKMVRVMMLAPFPSCSRPGWHATRRTAGSTAARPRSPFLVRRRLRTGRRAQLAGRLPPALVSHVTTSTPSSWPWRWPASALRAHLGDPPRRPQTAAAGRPAIRLAGARRWITHPPGARLSLRQEALHGPPQGLVQGFHLVDAVAAQAAADQPASRIEPCLATRRA